MNVEEKQLLVLHWAVVPDARPTPSGWQDATVTIPDLFDIEMNLLDRDWIDCDMSDQGSLPESYFEITFLGAMMYSLLLAKYGTPSL